MDLSCCIMQVHDEICAIVDWANSGFAVKIACFCRWFSVNTRNTQTFVNAWSVVEFGLDVQK